MNIRNILIPVDFSKYSDMAVDYGLMLAEKFGADVNLLHTVLLFREDVDEAEELVAYEDLVREKESERRALMASHASTCKDRGVAVTSTMLRGFSAADSILDYLRGNGVDLVVMGTHGHTGFKRFVYGSVAERVVRLSPVPVLTTHHSVSGDAPGSVLIPVDFSEYSRHAVDYGKALADTLNLQVEYLHVVEQSIHPAYAAGDVDSIFELDAGLRQRVIDRLIEFTGTGAGAAEFAVLEGKPHKAITRHARERGSGLIVMATRGESGLEHFLIGSTAERVVCIAPCPVLTVGRD